VTAQPHAPPEALPRRRAPRFRRAPTGELVLRPIHLAILRAVGRFGLLDSRMLERLVSTISAVRLRMHASALYHHGYLDRPQGQMATLFEGTGSRPLVSTLAQKGARLLLEHDGVSPPRVPNDVGRGHLAHELSVREVLVEAELSCRAVPALEFLLFHELVRLMPPLPRSPHRPDEWPVPVSYEGQTRTLFLKPDAIVAFKNREAAPERALRWAFLECDRGTMPILRRDLLQGSSIGRKLLSYAASHRDGIHRDRFGARAARVLIVTTTAERVRGMVEACGALSAAADLPGRLFLFADRPSLLGAPGFLSARWIDGEGRERTVFG
jgi:hypothetical protein